MNNHPMLEDGTKNLRADHRVRQALNDTVGKKAIAQVLTYGVGTSQIKRASG